MLSHLEGKHSIKRPSSSQSTSNSIASLLQRQGSKGVLEWFEKNLVRWVIADDMAFSAIESRFFQQMINDIPGVSMPVMSRNTLALRVRAEFELDRQKLIQELAISSQTIALSLNR
jgi:hypothetical protein